jgi:hypothetical protein
MRGRNLLVSHTSSQAIHSSPSYGNAISFQKLVNDRETRRADSIRFDPTTSNYLVLPCLRISPAQHHPITAPEPKASTH